MLFLIAPLLFIGFLSPAHSVTVDSEKMKSNEHLISLRDYDFVGEDQRLTALLAERMALLQAPLNLSEPEPVGPAPRPAVPWVNVVSTDFAELINASSLAPKPSGAPAPGYGRAPAPGIGRASAPSHDARFRRALEYKDPAFLDYNNKILDMMRQNIYSTQRRMIELDPFIHKYERDPRFRMAFIYKRLNEWLHDMRTGLFYLLKWRRWRTRVKRVIWYYEHILRLNINITYSIEQLLYLHKAYTKSLDEILPPEQRAVLEEMQKQQKKLSKMKDFSGMGTKIPN